MNVSPPYSPAICLLAGFLNLFFRPWRWRRYVPPKRWSKLNGLTRRYIPEDDTLHNHRCENLKSYRALECYLYVNLLCQETKEGRAALGTLPDTKLIYVGVFRPRVANAVLLFDDVWRDYRLISRLSAILPTVIGRTRQPYPLHCSNTRTFSA
jgi:hypothetical protein